MKSLFPFLGVLFRREVRGGSSALLEGGMARGRGVPGAGQTEAGRPGDGRRASLEAGRRQLGLRGGCEATAGAARRL